MKILSTLCRWAESIGVAHAVSQLRLEGQNDIARNLVIMHREGKLNG